MMHRMLVYIGKQRRLRAERAAKQAAEQRDRMARVEVSEPSGPGSGPLR